MNLGDLKRNTINTNVAAARYMPKRFNKNTNYGRRNNGNRDKYERAGDVGREPCRENNETNNNEGIKRDLNTPKTSRLHEIDVENNAAHNSTHDTRSARNSITKSKSFNDKGSVEVKGDVKTNLETTPAFSSNVGKEVDSVENKSHAR